MIRSRIAALATVGATIGVIAAVGLLDAAGPKDTLPPEKQALVDYANAVQRGGVAGDKSKDSNRPLITQVDAPPRLGMLGAAQAPTPGGIFSTNNAWAGWVSPTLFVIVYAGAPSDDPGRGLILVQRRSGSNGVLDAGAEETGGIVAAPAIGGPLQIVRIENGEVIVANPGGREFRFNPLTGAFD
jgi:hypothetical protein